MKRINKKGFTLIELLAVIVVLAIVLVVTIPAVLSSMKNARSKQFENASLAVKEWFEKQYQANKIGYAGSEFTTYLDTVCDAGTDDQKAECKKLTTYTSLTADVLKAAGIDPNDINLDYSGIVFSEDGKAEVNLFAKEGGKFSNGENHIFVNSNYGYVDMENTDNLFDLSKRTAYHSTTNKAGSDKKDISISKYYVDSNYLGNYSGSNVISELSVGANSIGFRVNTTNPSYGVMIPFLSIKDYQYVIEYKNAPNTNGKSATLYYGYYNSDGTYSAHQTINSTIRESLGNNKFKVTIPNKPSAYYNCLIVSGESYNAGEYVSISDVTVKLEKSN